MNGVRPGDIVRFEKGGIVGLGVVLSKAQGVLDVAPIGDEPAVSVKRGQVRELYRRVRS